MGFFHKDPKLLSNLEYACEALLKDIQSNIKDSKSSGSAVITYLSKIFNVRPDIIQLIVDDDFNVGVVSSYTRSGLLYLFHVIRDTIRGNKRQVSYIPQKDIEEIIIFIGAKFVKLLSPRQFVAVLLHEFGHVFHVAQQAQVFANKIMIVSAVLGKLIHLFILPFSIVIYLILVVGGFFGLSRWQMKLEYMSDSFVIKFGYHKELMEALSIFETYARYTRGKQSLLMKILKILLYGFDRLFEEHPKTSDRIRVLGQKTIEFVIREGESVNPKRINTFKKVMQSQTEKFIDIYKIKQKEVTDNANTSS